MKEPTTPPRCPECGSPLPPDSSEGLCPACLVRQALVSRTVVENAPAGSEPPTPPSPEEIAGKFPGYDILECLGRGGMGVVYKARQRSLNRLVAIKILAPERVHDSRFAERFAREAEMLARLSHPHIVTIHDFGETGGLFYLVMEFVDGVNLRDLLREGKLDPSQALAIVPPVCDALQYAHTKGIVHRDIKPENLLLDRDGRVKIADFGIAGLLGSAPDGGGTPPYAAPEQSAARAIDHRADIYALGVVLYEMLTGERPRGEVVRPSTKVHVDVRLDEVVLRALENKPELRYQTAEEFGTVVQTLSSQPAAAPQASGPAKREPGTTVAALGILLHLAGLGGLLAAVSWMFRVVGSTPNGASVSMGLMSAQLGDPILLSALALVSAVAGLVLIGYALVGSHCRAWFLYRFLTIYSWLLIFAVPVGTVLGVFFLVYCTKRRDEFVRGQRAAAPVWLPVALVLMIVGLGVLFTLRIRVPAHDATSNAPLVLSDDEEAAYLPMMTWLARIDEGDYAGSWSDLSGLMKTALGGGDEDRGKAKWVESLEAARGPLGAMILRRLVSTETAHSLPGAPDGAYVIMRFETRFDKKSNATETVTFVREADGVWRAAGYFIR